MTTTIQTPETYRIGEADIECRYPVTLGEWFLGRIFRWHGAWYAVAAGTGEETRVADGSVGKELAARHLYDEFMAGRITAMRQADSEAEAPVLFGPVPLLHSRMPVNDRNVEAAHVAMAGLTIYQWTPFGGYPGSDNPWYLRCELCGWSGPRYWSHLRGRNGNPPSPNRHAKYKKCVGKEKVRELITAYQQ
ncbi:hypothetical protein P9869_35610 [Streptomyces ossamyceticus]|nr:hypothetical protein [Streptomyces ossamyceticus]